MSSRSSSSISSRGRSVESEGRTIEISLPRNYERSDPIQVLLPDSIAELPSEYVYVIRMTADEEEFQRNPRYGIILPMRNDENLNYLGQLNFEENASHGPREFGYLLEVPGQSGTPQEVLARLPEQVRNLYGIDLEIPREAIQFVDELNTPLEPDNYVNRRDCRNRNHRNRIAIANSNTRNRNRCRYANRNLNTHGNNNNANRNSNTHSRREQNLNSNINRNRRHCPYGYFTNSNTNGNNNQNEAGLQNIIVYDTINNFNNALLCIRAALRDFNLILEQQNRRRRNH